MIEVGVLSWLRHVGDTSVQYQLESWIRNPGRGISDSLFKLVLVNCVSYVLLLPSSHWQCLTFTLLPCTGGWSGPPRSCSTQTIPTATGSAHLLRASTKMGQVHPVQRLSVEAFLNVPMLADVFCHRVLIIGRQLVFLYSIDTVCSTTGTMIRSTDIMYSSMWW